MIRVLQVVGTMDLGGAETLIMNIYRNIDRDKIQFDFLCHNRIEAKYTEEILAMGGKMYCVPGITHVGPLKYQENLYKFFCEHSEYKIVHSHHDMLSGMILKQAKRAGITNRFSHAHSTYTSKSIFGYLQLEFFKMYFQNNVTKAFACAKTAANTLYSGKLLNDYTFIPNVINVEQFKFNQEARMEMRKMLGIKEEIVLGHVGRFSEPKNHKFLVEIFENILHIDKDAHLILIGEGGLKEQIESIAKNKSIEKNIHFVGSKRNVYDYLSAMDLFLFPSLYEGLSVATVEAQAAGVPVLTSDSVSIEVAITDLVHQKSLHDTAQDWANKALQIINDTKECNRLIYADKVKDAGFDVLRVAQKMQEMYLRMHNKE